MTFEYPVLSDDEIKSQQEEYLASLKPLDPGIYDFQVLKSSFKISEKTGNHMIELQLKVFGHDGKEYVLWDWLVATKGMAFKTKHFWESVGHPEMYIGKAEVEDFENQMGKLETNIGKDQKGNLRARIKDYVPAPKNEEVPFDDDINF